MTWYGRRILFAVTLAVIVSADAYSQAPTSSPAMTLVVDESQAPRRIAFVHEQIPVRPGALSLAYPKWIPGEHGPTGPIYQFAALRVHSGNTNLPWTRDPEDIFTIHLNVPVGVSAIDVDFDTLMENTISDHQLLLAWNTTVLSARCGQNEIDDPAFGDFAAKLEASELADDYFWKW